MSSIIYVDGALIKVVENILLRFFIFVTRGAGVGKESHLVKYVSYEASQLLRDPAEPIALKVLLTAPTGTAAFGIIGTTLHHAFMLPLHLKEPIQSLTA